MDAQRSMLTNSLFLDFLLDNGLKVHNDMTRDIITIRFDYGSRSYQEELKHLKTMAARADEERVKELLQRADENMEKYDKKSKQELRTLFYTEGVSVTYWNHDRTDAESIKYRMLYRTPGKAKRGMCVFIADRLYKKAREFLYMGIQLPEHNAMITEIGAYASLVTSTIVGRIMIEPENILVLKDFDSFMTTSVVSIETDENDRCNAVRRDSYQLKNTLFDGQALIDVSVFPAWASGYVLLRQHMMKAAAFCTRIQDYFKDHFGDGYDSAVVKDMWGNERLAKDIKLITTDNALKWLKFGVSYEYWSEWVRKNGSLFGVVKTAHGSKLGDVQRMSYQMVNSLDIDTMDEVMKTTDEYLQTLQRDNNAFFDYLRLNNNFSKDYDVLIALCEHNSKFVFSEYFRDRKRQIINGYVTNMKSGKLIQNADNLVIVGNPYGMLMHSVGLNPEEDPTFCVEDGAIQCYTSRFDDGEYLAGFRSPHNSRNNILSLHNTYHEYYEKYFVFCDQIVAVNLVHTDLQDRANGSDQDSDMLYVTSESNIVAHAQRCCREYPTIANNIPKSTKHYSNTLENYALIDNTLAGSQLMIGMSSNLAQLCLSYTYNFDDSKYDEYVCILAVLAQAAIDNAKRTYQCDIPSEIDRIKKDMDIEKNGYPEFWKIIRPEFKAVKHTKSGDIHLINHDLKCPMNTLFFYKAKHIRRSERTIPMEEFFIKYNISVNKRKNKKIESLIQKYSIDLYKYNMDVNNEEEYLLLENDLENLIEDIRQIYISNNYLGLMSYLIDKTLLISAGFKRNKSNMTSKFYKNRSLLLKVLYTLNKSQFLQCFRASD